MNPRECVGLVHFSLLQYSWNTFVSWFLPTMIRCLVDEFNPNSHRAVHNQPPVFFLQVGCRGRLLLNEES